MFIIIFIMNVGCVRTHFFDLSEIMLLILLLYISLLLYYIYNIIVDIYKQVTFTLIYLENENDDILELYDSSKVLNDIGFEFSFKE